MEKDAFKTVVVFRMFKDGEVLALFPDIVNYRNGECESYQHVGQHGAADYGHCIQITTPAKPDEYADLQCELEGMGYNLDIRKRFYLKNA